MDKKGEKSKYLSDKLQDDYGKPLIGLHVVIGGPLAVSVAMWLNGFGWLWIAIGSFLALVILHRIYRSTGWKSLSLIKDDEQRFLSQLELKEKTAIFDGSNIYHFGVDHGLGSAALEQLVTKLRSDGYRVVCFFDANIYFRLKEAGLLSRRQKFSIKILRDQFGLRPNEIYVVPSGMQADPYIVELMNHLPISFAVTNDRYRDFAEDYDFLKGGDWRKGVSMQGKTLQLYKYKLH